MKQLLYSHNLSTAVVCFIHNGFSFCFANSASLHQAEVTHEQRSSIPADSPTDSCRLSNLKVLCAGIRLRLPGIDCKTGHINFLSRCLPLEELAQSCTNWPFQLFSQTLVFFTEDPLAHTLHGAAWISAPRPAVTAGVQGPGGSWAYLHERCLHLWICGLFSGSSGSKKCTAGRQAASTSPSPSPLLDKPEKTSSGQCWVSAVLPHLPTHPLQQQNQGPPCRKAQGSSWKSSSQASSAWKFVPTVPQGCQNPP